jgi:hypothetical protein
MVIGQKGWRTGNELCLSSLEKNKSAIYFLKLFFGGIFLFFVASQSCGYGYGSIGGGQPGTFY